VKTNNRLIIYDEFSFMLYKIDYRGASSFSDHRVDSMATVDDFLKTKIDL